MLSVEIHKTVDLLLYFASNEGKIRMPFEWERVTMEIAAALYEYLTERQDFPDRFRSVGFRHEPIAFKTEFNRFVMTMIFTDTEHKLESEENLWLVFAGMFKLAWRDRFGPGEDSYCANEVRDWRQSYIDVGQRSGKTFTLSVLEANHMKANISEEFSPETIRHCQNIASLMRKWIERDIEELKANGQYH